MLTEAALFPNHTEQDRAAIRHLSVQTAIYLRSRPHISVADIAWMTDIDFVNRHDLGEAHDVVLGRWKRASDRQQP